MKKLICVAALLAVAGSEVLAAAQPLVRLTSDARVVTEGDKVRFDFTFSRMTPPRGLDLRLTLYRDTDPLPGDVRYWVNGSRNVTGFELLRDSSGQITDAIVSIAPGVRTATLMSRTLRDDVDEGEERVVYQLANNGAYAIDREHNTAEFTITDRPVVRVTLDSPLPFREGSFMDLRIGLSRPAPAGGLPIRLALLRDSDPAPGDIRYFVAGSQGIADFEIVQRNGTIYHLLITVAEHETEALLRSEILMDDQPERPEIAVFGLAVGSGYSIHARQRELMFRLID